VVLRLRAGRVEAVRGEARLEGVRMDGAWVACDTLVFADQLLPAPFLLRGLGLLDLRPGLPAPVDDAGRLPMLGLWAAGTCVTPDVDHRSSYADGRRVGANLARERFAASPQEAARRP
jgi:hypothetical protein